MLRRVTSKSVSKGHASPSSEEDVSSPKSGHESKTLREERFNLIHGSYALAGGSSHSSTRGHKHSRGKSFETLEAMEEDEDVLKANDADSKDDIPDYYAYSLP